jgi:hypothetical protein
MQPLLAGLYGASTSGRVATGLRDGLSGLETISTWKKGTMLAAPAVQADLATMSMQMFAFPFVTG